MNGIYLDKKWEDIDTLPIPASTVIPMGAALTSDGSGAFVQASATDPIVGISLQTIATTDPDYADAKIIQFQRAGAIGLYTFTIPVTAGATAGSIGLTYNLDTSTSLDLSGAGVQFTVTKILIDTADGSITPGLVEVTCALPM